MSKEEHADLIEMVKTDNDAVIDRMYRGSDDPKCDIRHLPLKDGIARTIRLQEISLEHATERKSVEIGKLKLRGFDAADVVKIILAVAILILLCSDKVSRYFVDKAERFSANATMAATQSMAADAAKARRSQNSIKESE